MEKVREAILWSLYIKVVYKLIIKTVQLCCFSCNYLVEQSNRGGATTDETNGQESEFSLVVNLRNEIIKTVKFSVLSQFQKSF